MKKKRIIAAVFLFLLAGMGRAGAEAIYVWGSGTANWVDADKSNYSGAGEPDGLMCWAASAANALAWGGWAGYDGSTLISSGDDIYGFFVNSWPNTMGSSSSAYDWWFDNVDTSTSADPSADAGFYTDYNLTVPVGGPGYVYGGYYGTNPPTEGVLTGYVGAWDRAVTIGVSTTGFSHSLTLWGIDDVTNTLWFTDSDDGLNQLRSLNYYESGGALWLDNYTNSYLGATDLRIDEAWRLLANTMENGYGFAPASPDVSAVPEPGTFLLLAAGLGGFLLRRKP